MFRIFEPIMREIDKLVSEQVTKVKMERLQLKDSSRVSIKVCQHGAILREVLDQADRYLCYRQSSWLVVLGPVPISKKRLRSPTLGFLLYSQRRRKYSVQTLQ